MNEALMCAICKEPFSTPVIISVCSHNCKFINGILIDLVGKIAEGDSPNADHFYSITSLYIVKVCLPVLFVF